MKKFTVALLVLAAVLIATPFSQACDRQVGFATGGYGMTQSFGYAGGCGARQTVFNTGFAFAQPQLNFIAVPQRTVVVNSGFSAFASTGFATARVGFGGSRVGFGTSSFGGVGGANAVSQNGRNNISVINNGGGGGGTVIRQGGLRGLLFGSVVRTR